MFKKLFGKNAAKSEIPGKIKGYILTCDDIGYSRANLAFRSFSARNLQQLEKLEKELKSQFRYTNFKVEAIY